MVNNLGDRKSPKAPKDQVVPLTTWPFMEPGTSKWAAKTFEELSSVHCKVRSSSLPPEQGWGGSKTVFFFQAFFFDDK